jgi:hypothetical protein
VDLTIAGTTRRVLLASVPASPTEAAAVLQGGIRNADAAVAFAETRVVALGERLCILAGETGQVAFAGVAGGDTTTVVELQLAVAYPVRARVSGVESLNEIGVAIPK